MKEGWEYKKLGDVCNIFGRIGFRGYKREDYLESEKEGAISLSPSNIKGGILDYSKNTYISWYKYEESPEIKIFEGDVLLVKTASVGKSAIVDTLPHATTINPQFVVFKNIQTNNKYLFYNINSEYFQSQLKGITSGSSVPTLSQKALSELLIPVPPLPIQQSIVSELDEINNLLSLKRKELETYDKLAQSLFYEMFGDPVENEMGWEVKKLGDVVKFSQGMQVPLELQKFEKQQGDVRFLRIIDFTQGKDVPRYISDYDKKCLISVDDIAIVRYGTPGYICTGKEGVIANNLFRIIPITEVFDGKWFLLYWLNSEAFQSTVKGNQYGAALQAIKFSTINNLPIFLPPLPLQQLFAQRIEAIEEQKAHVKAAIEKLETLLAARMQYWFD